MSAPGQPAGRRASTGARRHADLPARHLNRCAGYGAVVVAAALALATAAVAEPALAWPGSTGGAAATAAREAAQAEAREKAARRIAEEARERPYAITETRQPCAEFDPLRRPFFGDLHVHTRLSQDASTQDTRGGPADAYAFALGAVLGIQPYDADGEPGRWLRLRRPLDFAAVTDHAELLGETFLCKTPGLPGYDSWQCRLYRRWPRMAYLWFNYWSSSSDSTERMGMCGAGGSECLRAAHKPWNDIRAAAEKYYDRSESCRFTTFVAYEWTGAPGANNLHRNVIFRNEAAPELPISRYEAPTPADLHRALIEGCRSERDGCEALAIPHNANLSGGLMFAESDASDPEVLARRARMEPLVEVMQHKGDSECPAGAADEACGFEKLPYDNFRGQTFHVLGNPPADSNYVRSALAEGLRLEAATGVNPYRMGIIASTDTHLAAPGAVEERDYPGHGGAGAGARGGLQGLADDIEFKPRGLAGLWAEENTRDALFSAMQRREAWGTSGPRIVVRFFGGWDYPRSMCGSTDFVAKGYDRGVPMGGQLPRPENTPRYGAPVFAVWALADPAEDGADLERVQIVKAWLDADGQTHETVVDVTEPPARPSLCAVWVDEDFRADQRAVYYARVLEVPTLRWSAQACDQAGVDCARGADEGLEACCRDDHRRRIRERAWTSPIWYAPASEPAAP